MITWQDNSKLTYDQWLLNRNKSLGASVFGLIVIGNPWSSNLELFYEMIGAPRNRVENIRMFLGKETEEINRNIHRHYAGTEQSVVDNIRSGRPIREIINRNATAFNSDYPNLSATPDGEIQPYGFYEGMKPGAEELKNITGWYLNSFETGLPTDNVMQIVGQMMICDYDFGELFYFVDNVRFELHPVLRQHTKNVEETILLHTTPFWNNVEKARPLYNQLFEAQRNFNLKLVGELQNEIATLEPPPQNTTGYRDFLTKRYKDKMEGIGIIKGTDPYLELARKHKELAKKIDDIETEQRKIEIELKHIIGDNSAIDFGKNGKLSWAENKAGKRIFLNKTK